MNEWTQLEKQLENRLHCWRPRRPSTKIKARLFRRAAAEERPGPLPLLWPWLAPALGVLLLAALVLARDSRGFGPWNMATPTGLVAKAVLGSPNLVAYYASKRHSDHNAWGAATFEWTNGASSLTTTPPWFQTNSLLQ